MLTLTLSAILSLQSAAETAIAIRSENPESWVLEYPVVVAPHVEDYYNCLKSRNHVIGGGLGFEAQHRSDIGKCIKQRERSLQAARNVLERRGSIAGFDAASMIPVFASIEAVHIARGRDLDQQLARRMGRPPTHYAPAAAPAAVNDASASEPAAPPLQTPSQSEGISNADN